MCKNKKHDNIVLYDFDGNVIQSKNDALEQKAAVFNSIFYLNVIRQRLSSYGLGSNYTVQLLPELVQARVHGMKISNDNPKVIATTPEPPSELV
jgi:hypothetical protein